MKHRSFRVDSHPPDTTNRGALTADQVLAANRVGIVLIQCPGNQQRQYGKQKHDDPTQMMGNAAQ